jgi:hypothetical protein
MIEGQQSGHGLVSDTPATDSGAAVTPKPAKVVETHIIKDPAAALDAAAKLDPAKATAKVRKPRKPRPPSPAKRMAKRNVAAAAASVARMAAGKAAKAVRARSAASDGECKAAYEAATLHAVASFAELPEKAPLELRLADGTTFIDGAIAVEREALTAEGDRVTYGAAVEIGPEGPPLRITEAWLIAGNGDAVRCEVGSGLVGGGGHHARIPPGHLLF